MKTLSSASFFRVFDLLVGTSNPGLRLDAWDIGGVRVEHERHGYSGRSHCFAIEVFLLIRPGRRGWELIVAKEYWWDGGHRRSIRTSRWSQLIGGSRREVLAWWREQEHALERRS
jgi:hypothetical protein